MVHALGWGLLLWLMCHSLFVITHIELTVNYGQVESKAQLAEDYMHV